MKHLLKAFVLFILTFSSCSKDDSESNYPDNNNSPSFALSSPSGLKATARTDGSVYISWNYVTGAMKYNVYRCNTTFGSYSLITTVTGTNATDYKPLNGYNYYKVSSVQNSIESELSSYVSVTISNNSGDNNGGSENGGSENGGGSGDTTPQKPTAPTGVTVSNEGNNYLPDVRIRWNPVTGATKYYVYKSSSANGSYSKIGENIYTLYSDSNAPTNGNSAYYKVKAVNSAGESAFSDYAKYTSVSNDEAFAPAIAYGNCTASGSTITLTWSFKTGQGYGKATNVVLRVWNPYAEEWQDTNLSATATSTSFNFTYKIDSYGYVKAGIVVSNAKGSSTPGAKIYDANNKKWLN